MIRTATIQQRLLLFLKKPIIPLPLGNRILRVAVEDEDETGISGSGNIFDKDWGSVSSRGCDSTKSAYTSSNTVVGSSTSSTFPTAIRKEGDRDTGRQWNLTRRRTGCDEESVLEEEERRLRDPRRCLTNARVEYRLVVDSDSDCTGPNIAAIMIPMEHTRRITLLLPLYSAACPGKRCRCDRAITEWSQMNRILPELS
eukprot:scaffold39961_cov52-Attheya_sp.AAC.6